MIRPEIIIRIVHADEKALKAILAGIEEEGVLYKVMDEQASQSVFALGDGAAKMSQIEVGIGLNEKEAALFIQKIKNTPLFTTTVKHRELGQNAARYVKGNPLIEI